MTEAQGQWRDRGMADWDDHVAGLSAELPRGESSSLSSGGSVDFEAEQGSEGSIDFEDLGSPDPQIQLPQPSTRHQPSGEGVEEAEAEDLEVLKVMLMEWRSYLEDANQRREEAERQVQGVMQEIDSVRAKMLLAAQAHKDRREAHLSRMADLQAQLLSAKKAQEETVQLNGSWLSQNPIHSHVEPGSKEEEDALFQAGLRASIQSSESGRAVDDLAALSAEKDPNNDGRKRMLDGLGVSFKNHSLDEAADHSIQHYSPIPAASVYAAFAQGMGLGPGGQDANHSALRAEQPVGSSANGGRANRRIPGRQGLGTPGVPEESSEPDSSFERNSIGLTIPSTPGTGIDQADKVDVETPGVDVEEADPGDVDGSWTYKQPGVEADDWEESEPYNNWVSDTQLIKLLVHLQNAGFSDEEELYDEALQTYGMPAVMQESFRARLKELHRTHNTSLETEQSHRQEQADSELSSTPATVSVGSRATIGFEEKFQGLSVSEGPTSEGRIIVLIKKGSKQFTVYAKQTESWRDLLIRAGTQLNTSPDYLVLHHEGWEQDFQPHPNTLITELRGFKAGNEFLLRCATVY